MSTDPSSSAGESIRNRRSATPLSMARLQELLGKGKTSGQAGLDPSMVLSDVLPLPGLREFHEAARSLITNFQAMPQAQEECLALGKRLQHMTGLMKDLAELGLEDFEYYQSRLEDSKRVFDDGMNSGRLGSRLTKASRNLDIWQALDRRLDSICLEAQVDLFGRLLLDQGEERMVKTIPPQEITNRSDPLEENRQCHMQRTFHATHRSLPVQYVTYHSERPEISRKIVKKNLRLLLQLSHNHLASIVGKTNGYGCHGIVFSADTLPVGEYLPRVGLRDVARCVLEYDSVVQYALQHECIPLDVTSVQVRGNGSIVVVPKIIDLPNVSLIRILLPGLLEEKVLLDPAVRLLAPYLATLGRRLKGMETKHTTFLEKLATSKTPWNELQTLRLASKHLGFYRDRRIGHLTRWEGSVTPAFKISILDIVSITKICDDGLNLRVIDSLNPLIPELNIYVSSLDSTRMRSGIQPVPQDNCDGWITYLIPRDSQNLSIDYFSNCINEEEIWSVFKQAAREHAGKLSIPLDSIYSCHEIRAEIGIKWESELSDAEQLYFHRRSNVMSDPADFWGYFSTSPTVECGAARSKLQQRGLKLTYKLELRWYGMEDDWECRYEALLDQLMEQTPGGFMSSAQNSQPGDITTKYSGGFGKEGVILEVNYN